MFKHIKNVIKVMEFVLTIFIVISWVEGIHGYSNGIRYSSRNIPVGILSDLTIENEMIKFMLYAYEKMGKMKCVVFVWDNYLGHLIQSIAHCPLNLHFCTNTYKYQVHLKGENISFNERKALTGAYQMGCEGYIILLKNPKNIIHLLQEGDQLQIINTRARFLIWYAGNDKHFEINFVWEKILNVIFFHSKAKRRKIGLLITIRQLKWPFALTSTESRIRVIELWGNINNSKNKYKNGVESSSLWYYDKTLDLKGTKLRIVLVEHPPSIIKYKDVNGEAKYSGTEVHIIHNLSKIMKFSYEFLEADKRSKWGGQFSKNDTICGNHGKKFYGAVAKLIYRESDIGIGSFYILNHYLKHLDMSIPIEVACTSFLTPNPLPKARYLALILPFKYDLWLLIIGICVIVGPFFLYILAHTNATRKREHEIYFYYKNIILTSFRIMLQVSIHLWPKRWATRVFIVGYWLFWLCITSGYKAGIVSFLTIPLYEKPLDTIKDLFSQSDIHYGGWGQELKKIFAQQLRVTFPDELAMTYSSKYKVIDDLDTGIGKVAEGNFALYENVRFLKFIRMTRNLSVNGSPSMRIMKQCVVPVHIGFAYQKNSPFTHTINRYIRLFQESGLTKRWAQNLIILTRERNRSVQEQRSRPIKEDDEDGENEPSIISKKQKVLSLEDLQGPFYVLLLGLSISIFSLILEHFIFNFIQSKKLKAQEYLTRILRTTIPNSISDDFSLVKNSDLKFLRQEFSHFGKNKQKFNKKKFISITDAKSKKTKKKVDLFKCTCQKLIAKKCACSSSDPLPFPYIE